MYRNSLFLITNNYDIAAICGGVCSCATCHLYVETEWAGRIPARSADEQVLVEETEAYEPEQSRLACQIEFTDELDGIRITLAPEE